MDPENIVFFEQRHQLVRQQCVHALITLPGLALELYKIKTVVKSGPQHGIGKLAVVLIIILLAEVKRGPGNVAAGHFLQRLIFVTNFTTPAKPESAGSFQCTHNADGESTGARFLIIRRCDTIRYYD